MNRLHTLVISLITRIPKNNNNLIFTLLLHLSQLSFGLLTFGTGVLEPGLDAAPRGAKD